MPGAEGRTGWPWDALPWQLNWGFIIIEASPFLMLLFAILFGALSNRLRLFRPKRGAVVEDIAGVVQENAAFLVPYVVIAAWVIVAISVFLYTLDAAQWGNNY